MKGYFNANCKKCESALSIPDHEWTESGEYYCYNCAMDYLGETI
jgi:acetone carboxylase gamma subunit